MELQGERLLPGPVQTTWDALNDPEVLKACIPGCDTLERSETGGFVATVALKIGPVSAKFKGKVDLTNVNAPNSYTLNFDGQGGVAGFSKGSADVALLAENGGTKLTYNARAQVGGKMAQIGSRLVDATAGKLTEDFFNAFEAQVRAKAGAAPAPVEAPAAAAGGNNIVWWVVGAALLVGAIWFMAR